MSAFAPASIPASETRVLRSLANGQNYLISVALPFHYAEHPEKTYAVIYVLDANLFFGMVVDMVRAMNVRVSFCSELPDAIIVGIGYPAAGSLVESHAQVMHLRMRDFLPVPDQGAEEFIRATFPIRDHIASGGAAEFLRFIHHELIPLVESEYRADTADRTLMGHSWGGLFALYAFFQQPQLFQRYADLPDGVLLDALDVALQSRLLEETTAGYRFRHPLIRLALMAGLGRRHVPALARWGLRSGGPAFRSPGRCLWVAGRHRCDWPAHFSFRRGRGRGDVRDACQPAGLRSPADPATLYGSPKPV